MSAALQPSDASLPASEASRRALQQMVARLASQVDAAQCEIGETRAILKDAVERLMPAFTALRCNEINRAELPADETETARTTRATRASGPAFSALQFQDISDQLLAHAQVRLVALLVEVNGIASALAPDDAGRPNMHNFMQKVVRANDNLAALDVSLVKPVGKNHLGTGEMEIF